MKSTLSLLLLLFSLMAVQPARSQVPSTLNYQGRMAVAGVNFTGTGLFKFALVSSDGTQTLWSNDGTSSGGGQPASAVSVGVASGLYSVQLGDTALANMTAVPASAFSSPGVSLRIWFSDGTNGFEHMTPDQKLASVGYAMVAATVPDGSITAAKLAPGVGGGGGGTIADGSITGSKLAPGAAAANLAAGGHGTVPFGGLIASTEVQSDELLAQGYVRDSGTLAVDAAWLPMPSGDTVAGHTAVWTGAELLIWGGVEPVVGSPGSSNSYSAINRGVRYDPATGAWAPISTNGAPVGRFGHSAVWTGTEMIVWGGQSTQGPIGSPPPGVLATGGRYNPATNTWSSMAANADAGAPPGMMDARRGHLAFCTPTEMLVWGGTTSNQEFGSTSLGGTSLRGRRYSLASNTWSNMAVTNMELMSIMSYKGVWTGSEMIIWGGGPPLAGMPPRAGRYNPTTDTWQPLPAPAGSPTMADNGFSLMWTGTEMIVWGGTAMGSTFLNTGYRFDPAADAGAGSWSPMSEAAAATGRARHQAVWSGTEMIVWGGYAGAMPSATLLNSGGRYDPAADTWQALSTTGALPARTEASVTMAGDKLVVWAGIQSDPSSSTPNQNNIKYLKQGGIYHPATDNWAPLSNGSPAPRFGHTAVWTGTELIVWGGTMSAMAPTGVTPTFDDGARFNPQTGRWTPLPALNAPAARHGHTAVWNGTEMIIWGGQSTPPPGGPPVANIVYNTGARYNPATNVWTPMSTTDAPSARSKHTAVWATYAPNNRMIVWGGTQDGSIISLISGGIYDPDTDTWGTMTDAPVMPGTYQALWTDATMSIYGGSPAKVYRYSPGADAWFSMAEPPPELSQGFQASPGVVWTGSISSSGTAQMLVFAPGMTPALASHSQFDTWQTLSTNGIPAHNTGNSFTYATAVWTGSEMIVWGLANTSNPSAVTVGGARYSPSADTWTALPVSSAPTQAHGANVWAGNEMLLWGGCITNGVGSISDKGHRYCLPKTYYFYRKL